MKLTRKVFAATMIVALLVMLIPQVGLAGPVPTNTACAPGTFLAKYETSLGGWEGGDSHGITLTDMSSNPFVSGSWTSIYPIGRIVFKDGNTTGGYQLHGYITYNPGEYAGSFNFTTNPDTFTPDPVGTPDWNWLPPGTSYTGEWPADKNISHIEFCTSNTAVTLDSFSATAVAGQVKLQWRTASETDNAGFNLYRSASIDGGQLVSVNRALISASMEAVDGASYSFVDKPGAGSFYYWLEDVDTSGKAVRHGPVKVSVKALLRRPVYRPLGPAN